MDRPGALDEVLDSLQEFKVYINGINGRTQHMDSYMTITDYPRLQAWWTIHAEDHAKETWMEMVACLLTPPAFCPNQKLLGYFIQDKLKE